MKVLHISYTNKGGAFIALKRIDEALKLNFADEYSSSFLIVNPIDRTPKNQVSPIKSRWSKMVNFIRPRIVSLAMGLIFKSNGTATESYNILSSNKIIKFVNESDFDIIHLHWIGGETISIKDFRRVKKPIIWTQHDSWAYLGRHHFPNWNDKETTEKNIDLYLKKLKAKSWENLSMEIVCVSDWLKEEVDKSETFIGNNVTRIHNCINTDFWETIDSKVARDLLKLSYGKIYLTLGAVNPTSDERKGFDILKDALALIPNEFKSIVEVLMFGTSGDDTVLSGIKTKFMGEISDELTLKILYAASSVILVPSYYESFGQTALEGISMCKPIVCFDSSGTVEVVKHLENGYVAKSYSATDFANGIVWSINNYATNEVQQISRKHAVENFDYKNIAPKYLGLYHKALLNKPLH